MDFSVLHQGRLQSPSFQCLERHGERRAETSDTQNNRTLQIRQPQRPRPRHHRPQQRQHNPMGIRRHHRVPARDLRLLQLPLLHLLPQQIPHSILAALPDLGPGPLLRPEGLVHVLR